MLGRLMPEKFHSRLQNIFLLAIFCVTLVIAAPAQTQTKRLILKDGSYQLAS